MDVPRKGVKRAKLIRRIVLGVVAAIALGVASVGLGQLKPAAPPVERGSVLIDKVKRGPMLVERRGLGTLVTEEVFWIPAINDGRVEKVHLRPGVPVHKETILMELSNPELTLQMVDYEWQVKQAEASLVELKVRLESQNLDLEAKRAQLQSEHTQARLRFERDEKLNQQGLTPDITLKLSRATADEMEKRVGIENKRIDISGESIEAQLAAQRVQIEKLKAAYALKRDQVDQLKIRAGADGVLQELALEVGQRVTPGTILAKVAEPRRLKAVLKIAETHAKDVLIGQTATIDTRNGEVKGRVSRIDPAVQNGTVTVDVKLEGKLPDGARPDLSVDGTIEIERMNDVVYVQRPVFGQPNSLITIFRLDAGTQEASRVQVRLGRTSVNTIEVVEGLRVGDEVILSDMSAFDAHNRVRLN